MELSNINRTKKHNHKNNLRLFKKLRHQLSYLNMEYEDILDVFKMAQSEFIKDMSRYCKHFNLKSPFVPLEEKQNKKKEKKNKPKEEDEDLKDLFRQIVKHTHPDKTSDLSKDEIEARTKLYLEASDGKSSGSFQKILKVALELNVEFDTIDGSLVAKMLDQVKVVTKKTQDMKKDLMYVWYFAGKTQKLAIFEHITNYKAGEDEVQLKDAGE